MADRETPQDHIRYDLLTQDALRQVVRRVLADVAVRGLPGEHHLYIGFDTGHPGVRLSTRMREKYPADMTIVLQHQFWDLAVTEHAFEVGLSFGGIPERLLVPFAAIRSFYDPSVQFGLDFEPIVLRPAEPEPEQKPTAPVALRPQPTAPRGAGSEPAALDSPPRRGGKADPPGKSAVPRIAPAAVPKAVEPPPPPEDEPPPASGGGADIVRLDRFRKK
jgi:uncharacterized protein